MDDFQHYAEGTQMCSERGSLYNTITQRSAALLLQWLESLICDLKNNF